MFFGIPLDLQLLHLKKTLTFWRPVCQTKMTGHLNHAIRWHSEHSAFSEHVAVAQHWVVHHHYLGPSSNICGGGGSLKPETLNALKYIMFPCLTQNEQQPTKPKTPSKTAWMAWMANCKQHSVEAWIPLEVPRRLLHRDDVATLRAVIPASCCSDIPAMQARGNNWLLIPDSQWVGPIVKTMAQTHLGCRRRLMYTCRIWSSTWLVLQANWTWAMRKPCKEIEQQRVVQHLQSSCYVYSLAHVLGWLTGQDVDD